MQPTYKILTLWKDVLVEMKLIPQNSHIIELI